MIRSVLATVLSLRVGVITAQGAGQFRVPLMTEPPKLDGRIEPGEWAASAGFDGFLTLHEGRLQRRRARGFVGATATHLYVAIRTQLPDEGALLAEVEADSLKAVYDDAVEVYVCPEPDAASRLDYQFLCNSLGRGGYNIHLLGAGREGPAWEGGYRQAHARQEGWWTAEIAIPLAGLGTGARGRKATDGLWAVNLCRDWKPDWCWSSLSGAYPHSGLRFAFTAEPAPGVRFEWAGDPSLPPADAQLSVCNPTREPLALKASLELVRNNMPELREQRTYCFRDRAARPEDRTTPPTDPDERN